MTNICLTRRSGTEIATRDLAIALRRLGHRVAIYSPTLGPFALDVMARGIPVTDRIDAIGFTPDIIHGHHNVAMAPALIRFPDTPAIFVCHDSSSPLDAPLLLGRIGAYVAVDAACVERMVVDGVDEAAIMVIPNGIDLDTYVLRTRWAERPRTGLLVTKSSAEYVDAVRAACRLESVSLEVVGPAFGRTVDNLADRFGAADLVFAMSRGAMEAAATGAGVIICDAFGFGGLLTVDQVTGWPDTSLSRRLLSPCVTVPCLREAIGQYNAASVQEVSRLLRARLNLADIASEFVSVYRRVVARARTDTTRNDAARLAAFVARALPKFGEPGEIDAAVEALASERRRIDGWLALHVPADDLGGVAFSESGLGQLMLGKGWSKPEEFGVWSEQSVAEIRVPAGLARLWQSRLVFDCTHYFPGVATTRERRTVDVFVDGKRVDPWVFSREVGDAECSRAITLAAPATAGPWISVALRINDAQSPLSAGLANDARTLGLGLRAIRRGS